MVGGFAMPERLNRYSPNLFWSLEGFFYVPFSDSILSAHTKQGQFIHSMSGKGRKPVKKILAYAARLLTMRVEVQSPYNRIIISYNREGHSAFAVFLLSFFIGIYRRVVSDMRCRSPPLHLDFYSSNYLTRTSAAGKPTRPIWTSFLFLFKAVCLKSCESNTRISIGIKSGGVIFFVPLS